jgi:nucleoid DNA-binding protein
MLGATVFESGLPTEQRRQLHLKMTSPERMFMDNHSMKGKSGLIRELIAVGLTVRQAEKAVNAVFDCMARAVGRGEMVEIPGGVIQAQIMNGAPRQASHRFRSVRTGEITVKTVNYPGRRRVVKFRPDVSLDLTPLPAPPTPEQIECRQLVTELIGMPPDDAIMESLLRAAAFPPQKPGNLLARLRDRKQRGRRYQDASKLAEDIETVYWL